MDSADVANSVKSLALVSIAALAAAVSLADQSDIFPGNVGIGTTSPTHKLSEDGTLKAKEIIVKTAGWSDYVFSDDYRLVTLSEVEQRIRRNGHLPDVPITADVAARGVAVGEMQNILLQKSEELTLHQITQEKRMQQLSTENAALRREVETLKAAHP